MRKNNTKLSEKTALNIISAAKLALTRNTEDIIALKSHLKAYRLYMGIISNLENNIAHLLIQTPGIYLLSIPGISLMIYAAELTGEVCDISRFAYANQIISMAGTCSKKDQSGEHDLQNLPISKRGNKFLRTILNQAALSLNAWCPDFHAYYSRKVQKKADRPGIARTATGNKFAKLAFALMKHESLYCPRSFDKLIKSPRDYSLSSYREILRKLKLFSSEKILPQDNYLEKIKQKLEKEYAINLTELKG